MLLRRFFDFIHRSGFKLKKKNNGILLRHLIEFSFHFFLETLGYYQDPTIPYLPMIQPADYVNKPQQKYFCENGCGRSYTSMNNMKRHVKVECSNDVKNFQCQVCLKKFRRNFHLKRHFNSVHGYECKKRKYYCIGNS